MIQAQQAEQERADIRFKRFILEASADFERTPHADLFRVNLFGQMLNRYDELVGKGLSYETACARVEREFFDIDRQMRDMGFLEYAQEAYSVWPQLTEDEAAQYLKESDASLHKRALGVAMCASCVFPLMLCAAIGEAYGTWRVEEAMALIGLVGMIAMIAVGIYCITQVKKPQKEETVQKGRFSLSGALRRKLAKLREAVEEKARRRKGKGIVLLVGCIAPVFIGGALDTLNMFSSMETFTVLGVAGMFPMIGAGVYELIMSSGEKKTINRLLSLKK